MGKIQKTFFKLKNKTRKITPSNIALGDKRTKRAIRIVEHISQLFTIDGLLYKKTGLFEGELGPAIFQFYCSAFFSLDIYSDRGFSHLSRSVESFNTSRQSFSFADGLTGMTWSLHHLKNINFLSDDDTNIIDNDILVAIDRATLLDFRDGNYDLMYGHIGKSIAFREISGELEKMEQACRELDQKAIWEDDSCYWKDQDYPAECLVNMGLAHGMPGIVLFLLQTANSISSSRDWINKLLEGAANWIIKHQNIDMYARFPTSVKITENVGHTSRLSWCYGDLGIAFMFMRLYHSTKSTKWKEQAIITMEILNERSIENSGVSIHKDTGLMDTGFCHGTTGISYLFNKLYQETGDPKILQKALLWLDLSLEHLEIIFHVDPVDAQIKDKEIDLGLLNGIAGAGLVILTFLNPTANTWDRIFLLD